MIYEVITWITLVIIIIWGRAEYRRRREIELMDDHDYFIEIHDRGM